jgi:hypothetical protein
MYIVRDLSGALAPVPIEVYYNGDLAADSTNRRYAGSLVKAMDFNDIDHGMFYTFAGLTTAMENVCGILAEEQAATGNYLPDDATYGMELKKIFPLLPTSIVRAEYVQADAAGTANYDTGATCSAASEEFTISITTADTLIGGWIYMLNGSEGGYLHYLDDSETTYAELATAANNAVASGDDFLVIEPACCRRVDFNATYTDIKSEVDDNVKADAIVGIMHYIQAPGVPFQRLDRNKHDNLYVPKARFFHDFTIPSATSATGTVTYTNAWINGINITT